MVQTGGRAMVWGIQIFPADLREYNEIRRFRYRKKQRKRVAEGMKVEVTEIGGLAGIVKWCNFEDPWETSRVFFQDLEKFP